MPQQQINNRYMAKVGMSPQQNWDETLTFDEVAKHFSVPIAEAASILGVCSSILKKICRDNGIPRWPYRKFLAGKTIEEIKGEAVREKEAGEEQIKASNVSEKKQPVCGTSAIGTSSETQLSKPPNQVTQSKSEGCTGNIAKGQQVDTSSNVVQSNSIRVTQTGKPHQHTKSSMSSYLDDFKQGFPQNGLSIVSHQWWGSSDSFPLRSEGGDSERSSTILSGGKRSEALGNELASTDESNQSMPKDKKNDIDGENCCSQRSPEPDHQMRVGEEDIYHLSMLTRTRRKSVEDGKKALRLSVSHGYGTYKLGKKQTLLIQNLFGSALPSQWKVNLNDSLSS